MAAAISRKMSDEMKIEDINPNVSFWSWLEHLCGIVFPIYLKNLFTFAGYDNPTSFCSITHSTYEQIEDFGKLEVFPVLLESNYKQSYITQEDKEKLLGPFYKNFYRRFKIAPGHRILISLAVNKVKKNLNL